MKNKIEVDEAAILDAVNEIAKRKLSEYETVGELSAAIRSIFSMTGISSPKISESDTLKSENAKLKKELEKLK